MSETVVIRPVRLSDAAAVAEIYWPFVSETSISFEIDPPSATEFSQRIERTTPDYPWFVPIGIFPAVGFKFDRWHDVAWFHLPVGVGN